MRGTNAIRHPGGWRSRDPGRICGAFALAVVLATAAVAGELKVDETAAGGGEFGLEAVTGVGCAFNDLVLGPGTVIGPQNSCEKILTSGATQVVNPGATLRTGVEIKFYDQFTAEADAVLEAHINPAIASAFPHLVDESPDGDKNYWAIYRLNLDPLTLALGEDIVHFGGYRSGGVPEFRVVLRRNAAPAENRLVLQARDNTVGGLVELAEGVTVPAGYSFVNVWWRTGDGNGQFMVSVNGEPAVGFVGLDNLVGRIDQVKVGFVEGTSVSTAGSYYLDDFASFRTLAP